MIPIGHHVPAITGQIYSWLQGWEFFLPKYATVIGIIGI